MAIQGVGCCGPSPAGEPHPIDVGCGLVGDGATTPVEVVTSGEWGSGALGFPCAETAGEPTFCDSAGAIRTVPPRLTRGFDVFVQETMDGPPGAAGTVQALHDVTLDITNPSACRTAVISTRVNVGGVRFTQNAGNDWSVQVGTSFASGGETPPAPVPTSTLLRRRVSESIVDVDEWEFPPIDTTISGGGFGFVGPGETVSARVGLFIVFNSSNPAAGPSGGVPGWRVRELGAYTWIHSLL